MQAGLIQSARYVATFALVAIVCQAWAQTPAEIVQRKKRSFVPVILKPDIRLNMIDFQGSGSVKSLAEFGFESTDLFASDVTTARGAGFNIPDFGVGDAADSQSLVIVDEWKRFNLEQRRFKMDASLPNPGGEVSIHLGVSIRSIIYVVLETPTVGKSKFALAYDLLKGGTDAPKVKSMWASTVVVGIGSKDLTAGLPSAWEILQPDALVTYLSKTAGVRKYAWDATTITPSILAITEYDFDLLNRTASP